MRQILAQADFPAMSRDALEALKATPDNDASLQRLANIVLREYALTLKVLRTANSAYYKRGGKPVQSAAHAMLLLGAQTVRSLAASLLVFEHYRKRSPGLKELMLMSMITANQARELAMLRNLADPEEAHLAGMFRNLGEVLVAGYFPREYARILNQMEVNRKAPGIAAFELLGFTFEDLGEALARHWGMPEAVVACTRADSPAGVTELGAVIACAHDLTTAVYRRDKDQRGDGVTDVLERYAKALTLTRADVGAIMKSALRETKEIFASAKVAIDDLRLRNQHDAAIRELGGWAGMATPASTDAVTGDPIVALRGDLMDEARKAADPSSGQDLNRVILTTLEAIYRGGPFERVVFCMMTPDGRSVRARFGLGTGVESLLESFAYDLTPRDGPVAVAMLRRQSLFVPVDRDFTAQELRFAQSLGAGCFGILPVVVAGKLIGCVYCDRPWNGRIPDKATVAFARQVCDGAARGMAARRYTPLATSAVRTPPATPPVPPYPASVKSDAVLKLLKGATAQSLSVELSIPEELLEQWRLDFLNGAMKGLGG
jgi:HD-like signal output (HDOD) protein